MDQNIDVSQHVLVPKHTKLSQEDAEKILAKLNITSIQLPRILKSDAAIKEFNAEPGDVIEIERESLTAGKIKFYRVVVHG